MRALAVLLCLLLAGAAPASAQEEGERPTIVVTTEVLGSVVRQVVGDAADVEVLMSGGVDPHSWQPSARQSASIFEADLVVANGLDLEEGLLGVLDQAAAEGVTVFEATDHVEPGPDADAIDDPHIWLDPHGMADVVAALSVVLAEGGIDVAASADATVSDLHDLDAQLTEILSVVPDDQRKLVTGHDSLGHFAARYSFDVVGTVIPGRSTSAEPSARDMAGLIETIRQEGVTAVFAEVGTPQSVAQVVADETGATLIELDITQLPPEGSYDDLLIGLAQAVADGLTAS